VKVFDAAYRRHVADLLRAPAPVIASVAAAAAAAHAARFVLWRPWKVVRLPIVWILHASYAWVVVFLTLRALAEVGLVPVGIATHALTVGAIGGLTLGMMTRTARGHTARPLRASVLETVAYVLVQCAAILRVFVPLAAPSLFIFSVVASGVLWSVAFSLFALTFWPILTKARLDGRPG